MKHRARHRKGINRLLMLLVSLAFLGMGDGVQYGTVKNPRFTELARRTPNLVALIHHKREGAIPIKEINFSGSVEVEGLQSEVHSGFLDFDLQNTHKLEIIDGDYVREQDRDELNGEPPHYVLTNWYVRTGSEDSSEPAIRKLLFPHDTQISGKLVEINVQRAWFLRDIEKITLPPNQPLPGMAVTSEMLLKQEVLAAPEPKVIEDEDNQ